MADDIDLFSGCAFDEGLEDGLRRIREASLHGGSVRFLFGRPKGTASFQVLDIDGSGEPRLSVDHAARLKGRHLPYLASCDSFEEALYDGLFVVSLLGWSDGIARVCVVKSFTMRGTATVIESLTRRLRLFGLLTNEAHIVRIGVHDYPETAYSIESGAGQPHPLSTIMEPMDQSQGSQFAEFWSEAGGVPAATLWYPSSALDLKPLFLLTPEVCRANGIARPSLCVFTCLGYPPLTDLVRGSLEWPKSEQMAEPVTIERNTPIRLDRSLIPRNCDGDYRFATKEGGWPDEGPDGALLTISIGEGSRLYRIRLALLEMSNRAFESQVILTGLFNPAFFCSVTDGCSFGGNMRCEAELFHLRNLARTRTFLPRYWIADHVRDHGSILWTDPRDRRTGLVLSADSIRCPDFTVRDRYLSTETLVLELAMNQVSRDGGE